MILWLVLVQRFSNKVTENKQLTYSLVYLHNIWMNNIFIDQIVISESFKEDIALSQNFNGWNTSWLLLLGHIESGHWYNGIVLLSFLKICLLINSKDELLVPRCAKCHLVLGINWGGILQVALICYFLLRCILLIINCSSYVIMLVNIPWHLF